MHCTYSKGPTFEITPGINLFVPVLLSKRLLDPQTLMSELMAQGQKCPKRLINSISVGHNKLGPMFCPTHMLFIDPGLDY